MRQKGFRKYGEKRSGKSASQREERRRHDLELLQKIGEISRLRFQVKFELIPKLGKERACTYTADFVYRDKAGNEVVEDSKGFRTQQYIIRRKLMLYRFGIVVKET